MDANDALTHAQPETFTASANGFIEVGVSMLALVFSKDLCHTLL